MGLPRSRGQGSGDISAGWREQEQAGGFRPGCRSDICAGERAGRTDGVGASQTTAHRLLRRPSRVSPSRRPVSGTDGAAWRSMASVRHGGIPRGGHWDHRSALLRHRLSWSSERHFRGRHPGALESAALPASTCPVRTLNSTSPQGLCGHVPASGKAGVSAHIPQAW